MLVVGIIIHQPVQSRRICWTSSSSSSTCTTSVPVFSANVVGSSYLRILTYKLLQVSVGNPITQAQKQWYLLWTCTSYQVCFRIMNTLKWMEQHIGVVKMCGRFWLPNEPIWVIFWEPPLDWSQGATLWTWDRNLGGFRRKSQTKTILGSPRNAPVERDCCWCWAGPARRRLRVVGFKGYNKKYLLVMRWVSTYFRDYSDYRISYPIHPWLRQSWQSSWGSSLDPLEAAVPMVPTVPVEVVSQTLGPLCFEQSMWRLVGT